MQLTISYQNILIKINEPQQVRRLRKQKVIVTEGANGDIAVYHNHTPLRFELHYDNQFIRPVQDRKELQNLLDHKVNGWQIIDNNSNSLH